MKILYTILLMLLAGCQIPTSVSIRGQGGRIPYNTVIQKTNKEEMLLNIVRIKYLDSPYFINVNGIANQLTYRSTSNPSFQVPFSNSSSSSTFNASYELFWQNQPTITYSPSYGGIYSREIVNPMDLNILQELIFAGWDISVVFGLAIQNFGSLLNYTEGNINPSDESCDFQKVISLLHYFQAKSQLRVGVNNTTDNRELHISFPAHDEKTPELLEYFKDGAKLVGESYIIQLTLGFKKYGIVPRSILSCLHYLSHGVDVPKKDREKVWVNNKTSCALRNKFRIKHSPVRPKGAFVAIMYNDLWFYIDEKDIQTKRTFVLLEELFHLHIYGGQTNEGILLSLPLG